MATLPLPGSSMMRLPEELLLAILHHLDIPELLCTSRTCRQLRALALDPQLHLHRLHSYSLSLTLLLPHRPSLQSLQPPASVIYLSRTHLAARRLHWSLVRIRLNRSLARRPPLATLVGANIVPRECCRRDRKSGQIILPAAAVGAGLLVERKRRVEREQVKEGLRVWLERKAGEIGRRMRKKDGGVGVGVGVLVWRLANRQKAADGLIAKAAVAGAAPCEGKGLREAGRVTGLKLFWEGLGNGSLVSTAG